MITSNERTVPINTGEVYPQDLNNSKSTEFLEDFLINFVPITENEEFKKNTEFHMVTCSKSYWFQKDNLELNNTTFEDKKVLPRKISFEEAKEIAFKNIQLFREKLKLDAEKEAKFYYGDEEED